MTESLFNQLHKQAEFQNIFKMFKMNKTWNDQENSLVYQCHGTTCNGQRNNSEFFGRNNQQVPPQTSLVRLN